MIKTFMLIIALLTFSLVFNQSKKNENDHYKYFDEEYNPISKTEYKIREWQKGLLSVQGDSINHKILTVRGYKGLLNNRKHLDSLLTLSTKREINAIKPLIVVYHPGKDPCNSSGSATRKSVKNYYDKMEKGILKIRKTNIIYIYKTKDKLFHKKDGNRNWIKDPNGIIEKLFFKRHYPCSSFVIINENNEFTSSFGEFSKEYLWNVFKSMNQN